MGKECIVCNRPDAEGHHIVFRKQQQEMIECPLNKIYLCYEHHKGNSGPHLNREIDLKYKRELQEKLQELFDKEYYSEDEIKIMLMIPKKNIYRFVKTLRSYFINTKVKYKTEDIIRKAMGGQLY